VRQCEQFGITIKAEVDWGEEVLNGKRAKLGSADIREVIMHLLTGNASRPNWLKVVVSGAYAVASLLTTGVCSIPSPHTGIHISAFRPVCR
jgi:hypothetical protein